MILIFSIFLLFSFALFLDKGNRQWGAVLKTLFGWFFFFYGIYNLFLVWNNGRTLEEFYSGAETFKLNIKELVFKITIPLIVSPVLLHGHSSKMVKYAVEKTDWHYNISRFFIIYDTIKVSIGFALLFSGFFGILSGIEHDFKLNTIYFLISYCILTGTELFSGALFLMDYLDIDIDIIKADVKNIE